MSKPDYGELSIVIPVLNEVSNIGSLLRSLKSAYPRAEIIVCDDGSEDGTVGVLRGFGKEVKFLDRRLQASHGLTASVIAGIGMVKRRYLIVMDGDGQHPPKTVEAIYRELTRRREVVVACRDAVPGWPLDRRLISFIAQALAKLRLAIGRKNAPRDLMSGFFGMKTEVAREAVECGAGKFMLKGYKVLFELLKYLPVRTEITEVGYVFGSRRGGESKMGPRHFLFFLRSVLC